MNTRNKLRLIMPIFTISLVIVTWIVFGQTESVGIIIYLIIMIFRPLDGFLGLLIGFLGFANLFGKVASLFGFCYH